MNLIEKWKNRETKKKLREENMNNYGCKHFIGPYFSVSISRLNVVGRFC